MQSKNAQIMIKLPQKTGMYKHDHAGIYTIVSICTKPTSKIFKKKKNLEPNKAKLYFIC